MNIFSGCGYDAHRFSNNRKLILGGVEIPFEEGLVGHSDADVLLHAIMDSLLSAAGLNDIGFFFPDSEAKYKDVSSLELLKKVYGILKENGFEPNNVTAAIICEEPKLKDYIPLMKQNISKALKVSLNRVGLAATTNEGMGFIGRKEGIGVIANSTVKEKKL
ncbi:MAG: 2-C-methyl-D-erythritol 2,4-cyclodiphosphate synthase [Firmicutes bacterium]|nr:2-C-methyl-D-erythritol 2,4-cyclodiphosphate synthase [Bacillota bacterium]